MVVDVAIVLLLCASVLIVATGGGWFEVGGVRVRARSVETLISILTALVLLRFAFRNSAPFLGRPQWPLHRLIAGCLALIAERLPERMVMALARPASGLAGLSAFAIVLKLLLAWHAPGFFSGDDVEIHEMSLGVLLDRPWPIWDLRNAFFPMVFIYPAQRLAMALGATAPETFVFAGRAVVAVVSTAAIPLTWLAARRLAPSEPRIAAMAVLFVLINKLSMSFGSSELPRPVSTVFVLAAFLCLLRPRASAAAAAGILLGTAIAFRFSEVVFLPAALLLSMRERRLLNGFVLLATASAASIAIIGTADLLYWHSPFASIRAIVDFTLVERRSSRGYEPMWAYAALVPAWSTPVFVALAVAGSGRRNPDAWWLWTPILLLGLLPHKESRYLIPIVPFLSIAAARGFVRMADWIRTRPSASGWRLWAREVFAPMFLLAVLHEAGGWRLLRSNEGVRLAQYLRGLGSSGVAAQDAWRLGGRPYLWHHEPFIDLPPETLADGQAAADVLGRVDFVALRSRTARTIGDQVLPGLGFARDPSWTGEDYALYVRPSR